MGTGESLSARNAPGCTVVISQPMLFPWVGLFEQVRLADVYVHYDTAQFSKGSFTNRVQFKTNRGHTKWMTIPVHAHLGDRIDEILIDEATPWAERHLHMLEENYRGAPHVDDMLKIVRNAYDARGERLVDLLVAGMEAAADYLGIDLRAKSRRASEMPPLTETGKSERVLEVVRRVGGTRYVTGHGAKNYLDHELFERSGVAVEYMDYRRTAYPQIHGEFDPHVTILDLIANVGKDGRRFVSSPSKHWRNFLNGPDR